MDKKPLISKWLAIGIIFLFVGTSIIPATAQDTWKSQSISQGTWLYVGGSGPGNYTRIQDAIDNASAGDIVFVYHGTYFENIRITELIFLIGEDRNTTIVDGNQNESTIITIAEGVTIQNFTIQNSRDNGIEVKSNHTKILGNVIKNNNGAGVWISLSCDYDYNVISGNMIMNNNWGIYLWRSHRNTIMKNVISFNKYGGIKGIVSSYNTITKNNILNNQYWGIEVDRYNNTVYANTIKDNWGGIRIEEAYNTKITENNFENDSIYLYLSGNTLITKNNFYQSHASFSNTGYNHNIWIGNYWDKSRLLPKPIIGEIGQVLPGNNYIHRLPWVNFDWFPAQKPYNIGG